MKDGTEGAYELIGQRLIAGAAGTNYVSVACAGSKATHSPVEKRIADIFSYIYERHIAKTKHIHSKSSCLDFKFPNLYSA